MKRVTISRLIVGMFILFGFGIQNRVEAQDVVFSKEFTWTYPKNTYGGYGFYWWHRTDGASRKDYGQLSPTDWTTPKNYYNGTFHMTFEVLDMPSKEPFLIQFGIWQKKLSPGHHNETVSPKKRITPGTKFSGSLGSPANWWVHPDGNRVDFTRPEGFFRIGIVLWNANPVCIPMGKDWSSAGCPENAAKFFPMRVRVTITATPGGGAPPPPTNPPPTTPPPSTVSPPSYSIDYANTRTKQKVSSEDQYSFKSDFSSAQNGNNDFLKLNPGQKVYFRKKADYSKKQTLNVPTRPNAPAFGINYFTAKTNDAVSSAYQHSNNADMSGAQNGNGNPVPLTPGQKKYIRKKATASAFASKIQTISPPARPAAPNFGIDFAKQQTSAAVNATHQYSNSADMSGPQNGNGNPVPLTPGQKKYIRKKATASAFASKTQTLNVPGRPAAPAFEIDFAKEKTSVAVSAEYQHSANENMSGATNGNGAPLNVTPGTKKYFRKKASSSAFASKIQTLDVPGRPAAPAFEIDFAMEQTKANVTANHQYSNSADMSGAMAGEGAPLKVTPGQKLYLKKKATASAFASKVQTLDVPGRPAAPAFEIDFAMEQTKANVTAKHQYSTQADMSGAMAGEDAPLKLTPGVNLHLRNKATASAFASKIQILAVPNRPASPMYSIDFVGEKTVEPVAAGDEYALSGNMNGALNGAELQLGLEPGTDLYFRTRSTTQAFASQISPLMVYARPVISSTESVMTQEATFTVNIDFMQGAGNFSADGITAVNATLGEVTMMPASKGAYGPNADEMTSYQVEVMGAEEGVISLEVMANAVVEGNFKSMPFEIDYQRNTTGIDSDEFTLGLYPNPTSGLVYLSSSVPLGTQVELSVFSATGKLVHQEKFSMDQKHLMDLEELGKGVYFLHFHTSEYKATRKLIINQ